MPKAAQKSFFSTVSEATLGNVSGRFWDVLGVKLGGVSAFRVVSITLQSCKVEGFKATGKLRQRQPQKSFFSRVSEATLGSFCGHFWDVYIGRELR